jgi:fluoride exporter
MLLFYSIATISLGASVGAVLRWFLDVSLNSLFPNMPLGTLTANLLGAYLIGMAMALFASQPQLSPEWRLLVITGFLGGLTTFSSFSAQVTQLMQQDKWVWAGTMIVSHVAGSLLMTALGLATFVLVKKLFL